VVNTTSKLSTFSVFAKRGLSSTSSQKFEIRSYFHSFTGPSFANYLDGKIYPINAIQATLKFVQLTESEYITLTNIISLLWAGDENEIGTEVGFLGRHIDSNTIIGSTPQEKMVRVCELTSLASQHSSLNLKVAQFLTYMLLLCALAIQLGGGVTTGCRTLIPPFNLKSGISNSSYTLPHLRLGFDMFKDEKQFSG